MRPAGTFVARAAEHFLPPDSTGADRQLRLSLAVIFIVFPPLAAVFSVLDWLQGERLTALLGGAACVILLSSLFTLRRARDIRWGYRLVLGAACLLLTAMAYFGAGGGYAVLWYYVFPAGFFYVFGVREGVAWTVLLLATASIVLLTPLGAEYPAGLAARFVVTYMLIGALACGMQVGRDLLYRELDGEKEQLEDALARVRTLREMLAMCAWCGKVRDDAGGWSKIEEYLIRETGTLVSHGVCEQCAEQMEADLEASLGGGPRSFG